MRATSTGHTVYTDESLDPDEVAYAAYCVCGWNGPWVPAGEFDKEGVLQAWNRAQRHGEAHLEEVARASPLGETA